MKIFLACRDDSGNEGRKVFQVEKAVFGLSFFGVGVGGVVLLGCIGYKLWN